MHEFMEFYRMDYTSNVFVHEANHKSTTDRQALVSKLNLGQADPSKPLLAVIIERLSTGAVPRAGGSGSIPDNSATLQKEKEGIEASIKDLRKPAEIKENSGPTKQSPTLDKPAANTTSVPAARPKIEPLPEIPPRKETNKMMGAKKESDEFSDKPVSSKTLEQQQPADIFGKKNPAQQGTPAGANLPDDAMKKKFDQNAKIVSPDLDDDFDDPVLNDDPYQHAHDDHADGVEEEVNDMNHLVTSDEMYMSESYGYNFSVTSEKLDEEFDYVEDIEPVD